jgi:isoaspartyl peptidase/L-asparaginase-like protein (Ntn-hydrolase superfamily)
MKTEKPFKMYAACMENTGQFGAVAAISRIKNPKIFYYELIGLILFSS